MDLFNTPYYKFHKHALRVCGLWPYESKLKRRFNFVFYSLVTFSIIYTLVSGLREKWSTDIVVTFETYMTLLFVSLGFAECAILYSKDKQVKILYERIENDWQKLSDESELDILRTYSLQGRKLMILTITVCLPCYLVFAGCTYIPRILTGNVWKDHSKDFPYYSSHMIISEDVYYIQVGVHVSFGIIHAGFSYLAVSATYISSVKHMCALYAITRHRLQNVVDLKDKKALKYLVSDALCVPQLIEVMDIHKEAINGIFLIEKVFSSCFLLFEVICLPGFAMLIFDLKYRADAYNLFRMMMILLVLILYTFFMNWTGQQVIQECDDVYLTSYNIEWYRMSSNARILVLMIMQRSGKCERLTAGYILILSLENFATILKTAWSFATVFLTTQKSMKYYDEVIPRNLSREYF